MKTGSKLKNWGTEGTKEQKELKKVGNEEGKTNCRTAFGEDLGKPGDERRVRTEAQLKLENRGNWNTVGT